MLDDEVETVRCVRLWTLARAPSADCKPDSALWTLPSADIWAFSGVSWVCSVAAGSWLAALACWISDWISLELRRLCTCEDIGQFHSLYRGLPVPGVLPGTGSHTGAKRRLLLLQQPQETLLQGA